MTEWPASGDETSGDCEECYSSFMIYTESRYRTCVWEKKNSKLFTVYLKTLETIEKLFGKPASSERATWLG